MAPATPNLLITKTAIFTNDPEELLRIYSLAERGRIDNVCEKDSKLSALRLRSVNVQSPTQTG